MSKLKKKACRGTLIVPSGMTLNREDRIRPGHIQRQRLKYPGILLFHLTLIVGRNTMIQVAQLQMDQKTTALNNVHDPGIHHNKVVARSGDSGTMCRAG